MTLLRAHPSRLIRSRSPCFWSPIWVNSRAIHCLMEIRDVYTRFCFFEGHSLEKASSRLMFQTYVFLFLFVLARFRLLLGQHSRSFDACADSCADSRFRPPCDVILRSNGHLASPHGPSPSFSSTPSVYYLVVDSPARESSRIYIRSRKMSERDFST